MAAVTPWRPGGRRLRRLAGWLERGGVDIASLGVHHDGDGQWSARARRAIPGGEVILHLPHRFLLTDEIARGSEIGRRIRASGIELRNEQSHLAAFLLQERRARESSWSPYIGALPASYRRMPLCFGPRGLALLAGSFTLGMIRRQRAELAAEYAELCRRVRAFRGFTLGDFVWARLTVLTRVFTITVEERDILALVPMADLLNHKLPGETSWTHDDRRQGFTVTAERDFAPGAAIHDSYGRKCNGRFFVHYGFCLDENEDNHASIRFGGDSPAGPWAAGAGRKFQVPASWSEDSSRRLFSSLRLAVAAARGAPAAADHAAAKEEVGPISADNEGAVLLALADACAAALRGFPTTLEEDDLLLADPRLTRDARHCILMRRGEKRVLRYYMDLAATALPWLRRPPQELAGAAAEGRLGAGGFEDYLTAVAVSIGAGLPWVRSDEQKGQGRRQRHRGK